MTFVAGATPARIAARGVALAVGLPDHARKMARDRRKPAAGRFDSEVDVMRDYRANNDTGSLDGVQRNAPAPGKRTRSESLPVRSGSTALVQRSEAAPLASHEDPFGLHLLGSDVPMEPDAAAHERVGHGADGSPVTGERVRDARDAPSNGAVVQRQAAPVSAKDGDKHGGTTTPEVTHEDLEKIHLVEAYKDIVATEFEAMRHGVQRTIAQLEKRRPKKPDLLGGMVNMAASAAIAGAAGVVAEVVARKLSSYVAEGYTTFKQAHQRFATDSLKDHLKKSFRVGSSAAKGDVMDELALSLWDAQFKKIQAAQTDFFASFGDHTGSEMAALPIDVLRAAVARAHQSANDPEIADAASRNTAVEWANLVAQLHHGDGSWDHWAGPHGSAHAVPTVYSAGNPGHSNDPENHASNSNVSPDSDSIRDLVDDDQEKMNPDSNGILEIDLWGTGLDERGRIREFELFTRSGFGMRLGGVSNHVKRMVAQFSTVRDLKMNKIVSLYSSRGNHLNPPKPQGRFLITADGYIRRWTTDGGELEVFNAAEFAQGLSPASVQ